MTVCTTADLRLGVRKMLAAIKCSSCRRVLGLTARCSETLLMVSSSSNSTSLPSEEEDPRRMERKSSSLTFPTRERRTLAFRECWAFGPIMT